MGSPNVSLSYGARREVVAQIAPRYQEATDAEKTLLLDQVVKLTGYVRKYAIQLLNQVPQNAMCILRPRQPIYGSAVQEALFLAWRTIQYPCAQRLVPCLPELIPVLEQDGHLQLDEDHRRQLLAMSVRTAERLLSTQRRPTPHWLLDHQARDIAQTPDSHPHLCPVGRSSSRFSGSGSGSALWRQCFWWLSLHVDIDGYRHWLDRMSSFAQSEPGNRAGSRSSKNKAEPGGLFL